MTDTTQKRSHGRPPGQVPGSRRSGKRFQIWASQSEVQVIEAAARAAEVSVSEFLIRSALAAADGLDAIDEMTDIEKLASILLEFAEHKRQLANEMLDWKRGELFRAHEDERARLLQHQAQDLIGYADEIKEWWGKR